VLDNLIETACQQNLHLQIAALRIMKTRALHIIKQQVSEGFTSHFYLLLFSVFPSVLKQSMGCELPRAPG